MIFVRFTSVKSITCHVSTRALDEYLILSALDQELGAAADVEVLPPLRVGSIMIVTSRLARAVASFSSFVECLPF